MTDVSTTPVRSWAAPVSWVFGLLWIGSAIVGLFRRDANPALIVAALAGVLILPPIVARLRVHIPAFRPFWAPPVIALALHLVVGGAVKWATSSMATAPKPASVAETTQPTIKDPVLEAGAKAKAEADRIAAEYAAKSPGERFVDLINGQLLVRVDAVSTSEPKSMLEVWGRLGEIETLAVQVREGRATQMNEVQKESMAKFEAALSAKQAVVFPQLRKAYRALSKSTLWEKDIDVRGNGRMIEYIGGTFASNANIKAAQEAMGADLKRLRFDTARYRWIPNGDGAQYDLDAPPDRKIVYQDQK